MADVVAGLETILATQEKANTKCIKAMKNRIFGGIKEPSYLIPFKREKNQFNIDTINAASENFSTANRISYEGVGTMYKGKLQNGQAIAIFGLSDETEYELYKNEKSILVNVEHENLIQLHGYCIDGTKVYLVYDFAPYETLDRLISGCSSAPFEWSQRCKILQGVGRVLRYLHNHAHVRVMHFDAKPGKIMLDESMNPKLFGFYSARSIAMKEADCIRIDVAHRIANMAESEMKKRFIMVGLLCIQIDATHRPGMEEVVAMLMGTSTPDDLLSEIKAMNKQE
ncbi:concanavalin A-like lectin/glucanase domain, Serine/threonine-protein kinase Rad53 [Artemisia annua]|uniref:Concanavalin A-like lectin/glucanase domain, Serine/threonine-protein kinase Rad53 n=1 Tax=Artemisia annua TaxID=35608 RepID=A0A2U1KVA0_ARTAN|nr:concanavalin A-like lectin/glucanase domain, Serine/threonine-protein kinase Rad53 [Artemisia annua]